MHILLRIVRIILVMVIVMVMGNRALPITIAITITDLSPVAPCDAAGIGRPVNPVLRL